MKGQGSSRTEGEQVPFLGRIDKPLLVNYILGTSECCFLEIHQIYFL
mgnify:CR=1 FL=1